MRPKLSNAADCAGFVKKLEEKESLEIKNLLCSIRARKPRTGSQDRGRENVNRNAADLRGCDFSIAKQQQLLKSRFNCPAFFAINCTHYDRGKCRNSVDRCRAR
jgi:hypothetical protein